MYLGIDLGTSAVKAVLVDDEDRVVAESSGPLQVMRPRPLWSEQDPEDWWTAAGTAVAELRTRVDLGGVRGIGLSGQMHGATLLDASGLPLRPCILWNDGRSAIECAKLEMDVPECREISGNLVMPGFTAPKLIWVRDHEPEIFGRVKQVLLPKDYLRLRMTGDCASDLSDASGTLWLDVAKRDWSDPLLEACGLSRTAMPSLYEGSQVTGTLLEGVARAWGLPRVPVAAGGGDQAAGAVGVGVVAPGDTSLAL
ncbi:MAG: FGGY family carbohydrate kinase, partial [Myxococcota bacterium]